MKNQPVGLAMTTKVAAKEPSLADPGRLKIGCEQLSDGASRQFLGAPSFLLSSGAVFLTEATIIAG